MVFSSTTFLFLFLPVLLGLSLLAPRPLKNTILLVASLLFYAWGEVTLVVLMLACIGVNHVLGLLVEKVRERSAGRWVVAAAVVANLGFLGFYKYANFFVENMNVLLSGLGLAPILWTKVRLPIGISFFTFQALSYVIDVYRGDAPAQRNPFRLALYISLFPQLIAGPIVRYKDIASQLLRRHVDLAGMATGVQRFVLGLGKKLLLANTLALPADEIFALPGSELTTGLAWLGVVCYTLQIYFDFSGYSDMAIGLGRMLGFHFLENFNYPYVARSMTEFWRRWHISLSSWFRDYLYIPLGGSRGRPWRTYFNLALVFLLCGFWHGASWSFVVWGACHGVLLVGERVGRRWFSVDPPRVLRHGYVLLMAMVTWVFFRAETLQGAGSMLAALAGFGSGSGLDQYPEMYLTAELWLVFAAGLVGAMPAVPAAVAWFEGVAQRPGALSVSLRAAGSLVVVVAVLGVLLLSALQLSASTYNPFIYYRF